VQCIGRRQCGSKQCGACELPDGPRGPVGCGWSGVRGPLKRLFNNLEFQIMRLTKLLPIVILSLASSMAMAKDNNNKNNNNFDSVNCSTLDNDKLRKECRERKYGSKDGKKVDCGKLDNDKLRKECRQEKWD
jgi:hypothetical protein